MIDTVLSSPFFALALTCLAWTVGVWLQKKTGMILCNPVIVSTVLIILVLVLLRIPYSTYSTGSSYISMMLGPVTAVLALNIYNQRRLLGKYFIPVVVGCLAGSLTSVGSILLLCKLLSVDSAITASLLPKSVTTAIALAVSGNRGGIAGVTMAAVLISGSMGAIFAPLFANVFRIKDPVAEGIAIGACSHAIGTSKALEIGQLQGGMSSIAICICGIITSILVLFIPA